MLVPFYQKELPTSVPSPKRATSFFLESLRDFPFDEELIPRPQVHLLAKKVGQWCGSEGCGALEIQIRALLR